MADIDRIVDEVWEERCGGRSCTFHHRAEPVCLLQWNRPQWFAVHYCLPKEIILLSL